MSGQQPEEQIITPNPQSPVSNLINAIQPPEQPEETPQVGFQPETQMGVAPQLREQPEGAPKPDPNESVGMLKAEIKTYHDSILQYGGDPQPQYEVGGLV